MDPARFAITISNQTRLSLKSSLGSPAELMGRVLERLNGEDRFSLELWRLPDGVNFAKVDLKKWPVEYLQAGGSSAALTVEMRRLESGVARHYILGRPRSGTEQEAPGDPKAVTQVSWQGSSAEVRSDELFTAAEALDVFLAYLDAGGQAPAGYSLRLTSLGRE